MGVSRRSIVFGRGKRPPSEDDCAEHTLRILNPSVSSYRQKDSPTRSPNRAANNVSESGGEDDSRDNNNPEPMETSAENITVVTETKKPTAVKRKTGTFWNTDEALTFYEGLKEVIIELVDVPKIIKFFSTAKILSKSSLF
jgi:hypothetical protein